MRSEKPRRHSISSPSKQRRRYQPALRHGDENENTEWTADARRAFDWFLGGNDLRTTLVDSNTGSCLDGLHPDRPNENRGAESAVSYLLGLAEMRQFASRRSSDIACRTRSQASSQRLTYLHRHTNDPRGPLLSQSMFLNRQTLYLRPDPARVVVRPFKPATEPRDLNPTDKTRANHIVGRVLSLELDAAEPAVGGRARKLRWSPQEPA